MLSTAMQPIAADLAAPRSLAGREGRQVDLVESDGGYLARQPGLVDGVQSSYTGEVVGREQSTRVQRASMTAVECVITPRRVNCDSKQWTRRRIAYDEEPSAR